MEAPKAAAVVLEENSKVQERGGKKDLSVSLRRERTEGRCRVMTSVMTFFIGNKPIEFVNSLCHLGHLINSELSDRRRRHY